MLCFPKPPTEFPPSRATSALKKEDEFMQLHGSKAARAIYLVGEAIAAITAFLCTRLASLPMLVRRRALALLAREHTRFT